MRLTISALGLVLFDLELTQDADEECSLDGGTTASTPISFDRSGDSRWDPGADYGAGEPEDGKW